jgi:N,N'-diacetyllegionaminate synthase
MKTVSCFELAGRAVGPGHPPLVVAEVAQAHDGSLGTAHAYIDVAARAGADAVKFQTHIAAAESSPREPWRVKFSPQDDTRYAYWQRMEFTAEQWAGLKAHADAAGLLFLSSPFSREAIALLESIGVCGWKLGAGETASVDLLRQVGATRKPVLLSSGMSPWSDVDAAVRLLQGMDCPFGVYQCTSAYPCPPEKTGLNVIAEIRARYGCPTGLSDHSGVPYAGLAAAALGADMIEVHIAFSRDCFGPDVPASLIPSELKLLTDGVAWIHRARQHPVDKDAIAEELTGLRAVFQKSAVALRDLPEGHVLGEADVGLRKPGGGLNADQASALLGRRLRVALPRFTALSPEQFEP